MKLTKQSIGLGGCLALLVSIMISMVIGPLARGYVLAQLWAWFVVQEFGLHPLTMAHAVGVGFVIHFLTYTYVNPVKSESTDDTVSDVCFRIVMFPIVMAGIALFFGWLIHQLY